MIPWDLEDWIIEVGHTVVERQTSGSGDLPPLDNFLYEIWLLDTETRNGGLSQYFFNRGISQWRSCVSASISNGLSNFAPFASVVDTIISDATEPGEAIIDAGSSEDIWLAHQEAVVRQLRELHRGAP
ncbi:DMP19 family protein [Xanthomonas euroxanthea]|uniref:DMP19 family protein n=1 Tax=Xanthomonas euroxanthea TaxID=2259622 RepID=UPI003CCCA0B8